MPEEKPAADPGGKCFDISCTIAVIYPVTAHYLNISGEDVSYTSAKITLCYIFLTKNHTTLFHVSVE
jgi:hypothetical protein